MTHEELLAKIDSLSCCSGAHELALRAVVELHKPYESKSYGLLCKHCDEDPSYPCGTIQEIESALQ
jgi:hypothetical protein